MARIRTIKPEFWKHEALSELPEATHMLAAALLNYADDEGYFNANPALVKAECCPLREPSVSIQGSLSELSRIGYIRIGRGKDGRLYGHIVRFADHQKVNRLTPSKIKDLKVDWEGYHGALTEPSLSPHGALTEPSLLEGNREQGKEGERKGCGEGVSNGRATASPNGAATPRGARLSRDWTPTESDREHAKSIGLTDRQIDAAADRFRDYWIAKPGQNGVKLDWSATWRNWCRKDAAAAAGQSRGPPKRDVLSSLDALSRAGDD